MKNRSDIDIQLQRASTRLKINHNHFKFIEQRTHVISQTFFRTDPEIPERKI